MTDQTHEPGAGDVTIMLDGKELVMRPTLEACLTISKLAGNSLTAAMMRITDRLDFEFICDIVSIGIGETSQNLKKQVQQAVYEQGVISIAGDVALFVRVIMNGGRLPDGEAGDGGADGPLANRSQSENSTAA